MNNFLKILFIILLLFYLNNNKYNIIFGGRKKLHIAIKILIKCCKKLKFKYKVINKHKIYITHNNKLLKFNNTLNNINTNICKKIKCFKTSVNKILLKNKINVPQHEVFNKITTLNDIDYIINKKITNYPLVVKPIDSMDGENVFVNIKDDMQLKDILLKYFLNKNLKYSKTNKIMIEPYIIGQDYRVICYNNMILDVIKRTPGYIIGDGIHTIKELTNLKNKTDKYHIKHPIIINEPYLNSNGLTCDSIIKKKQKINPHYIGTLRYGGYLERFPIDKIHPDNIKLFENTNKILGFKISGIDILIGDISKSYKLQNCGINEVNSNPNILTAYYADEKYSINTIIKILKLYFEIN
tara:strand:- start:1234 stop:2295 length:1062 start_codon:yes stop_codon:yes gene_type:complete